ncbi:MAG: polyprenyl synthetase family protein [Limnochordia bacterium]|jgi:geranylgeranyl diphosphate synthase type II
MHVGELKEYMAQRAAWVERALEEYLPGEGTMPAIIHEAMRYSTLGGGKRVRGVLTIMGAEVAGEEGAKVLPLAAAVEMIHAYSLVHDDLPCMDDDDYRRGKLANHKVFGEAMALLAGDALLTRAFYVLTFLENNQVAVIREVAAACGSEGLIGGQVVDLQSEEKEVDGATLDYIHRHKTGDLITISLRAGAMVAGAEGQLLDQLTTYGRELGLLFQITDDILDIEGDAAKLGKPVGSDAGAKKATYPRVHGMEAAKAAAQGAARRAKDAIASLGEQAWALNSLVDYILHRDH